MGSPPLKRVMIGGGFFAKFQAEACTRIEARLPDLVRATDAYRRLTTAHDNDVYDWDPALNSNLDFRRDQQHSDWAQMTAFERKLRASPVVYSRFRQLKETLGRLPYWDMVPADDLAAGGPFLAQPGHVYAFFAESSKIVVNLRDLEGGAAGERRRAGLLVLRAIQ